MPEAAVCEANRPQLNGGRQRRMMQPYSQGWSGGYGAWIACIFGCCRGRCGSCGAGDPTVQASEGAADEADHCLGRGHRQGGVNDPPSGTVMLLRLLKISVVLLAAGALGVGWGFGG